MKKSSVGTTILWWLEAIVSARVLLFTIPVLINNQMTGTTKSSGAENWFMLMITVAAVLYLFVGLMSIIGHKLAPMFHFLAAAVVLVMTIGMVMQSSGSTGGLNVGFFIPLVFASIFTALAYFLTKKTQTQ
ncbi:MAG: hypothetical protein K8I00_03850 [Candidatus Omnitrophica bacterium]|nr:hypothetical protein [Candidatus Omnitrophota bacterium]